MLALLIILGILMYVVMVMVGMLSHCLDKVPRSQRDKKYVKFRRFLDFDFFGLDNYQGQRYNQDMLKRQFQNQKPREQK